MTVIQIPGYSPGWWALPELVAAWQAAGSPPINSAGRLRGEQQDLYDRWQAGEPGYNPADNPDEEWRQLAHVRGAALDIDPTPDRVRRLAAAGLVRPLDYEPWHWTLPGDARRFPLVTSAPKPPTQPKPIIQEDPDMGPIIIVQRTDSSKPKGLYDVEKGRIVRDITRAENNLFRAISTASDGTVVYGTVSDDDYKALGGK